MYVYIYTHSFYFKQMMTLIKKKEPAQTREVSFAKILNAHKKMNNKSKQDFLSQCPYVVLKTTIVEIILALA